MEESWYSRNAERVKANVKAYRERNPRDEARHETKSFRRWLGRCLRAARHGDKKRCRRFDLTIDYLVEMLAAQNFKCAVTGIPLTHEFNDLCSASVDRLKCSEGHVMGNVHIVCMWVNLARKHYPLEKLRNALDVYFEARTRGDE